MPIHLETHLRAQRSAGRKLLVPYVTGGLLNWKEARFGDDLDADSLDLVELVMALEEEFGVEVPEEDLDGIETIGQAYDLVVSKL